MDRGRTAAALLALATCIMFSVAAPTADNQALDLYKEPTEGCYYNFQHYREGDRIMTNEPCLNCTCHNKMLMCYLKVCPFTKAIGQDCTVEKRADQCCPIVTCPDVPVDLLTSTSTTSPAEYGETGVVKADKYGCTINGKYLPEGAKVPPTPNKPCEHCYCIRNMTTCVMQECTLHVDGCTPIYNKDVCCPMRYVCDHPKDEIPLLDDMTTTVRPTQGFILTTTEAPTTEMESKKQCVKNDQLYQDGARLETENPCEHCFCMKGDVVCVVQECGMPVEHEGKSCTALPPRKGQCCPDRYICDGDEFSTDATAETPFDDLNTIVPPKRIVEEGSGYRKESDDIPVFETEGSGDEPEIQKTTQLFMNEIETSTENVINKLPTIEDIDKLTTLSQTWSEATLPSKNQYNDDEYVTNATKSSIPDDQLIKTTENIIKLGTSLTYDFAEQSTESTIHKKTTTIYETEEQNTSIKEAQVTTELFIKDSTLPADLENISHTSANLEYDITEQSILTTDKPQSEILKPKPTSPEKEYLSTMKTVMEDYTTQEIPKIEPEVTTVDETKVVTTEEPTELLTNRIIENKPEFEASTQTLPTKTEEAFGTEELKTTTIQPEEIIQYSTDLSVKAEKDNPYTTENNLKVEDESTTSAIPDVSKDTLMSNAFEFSTSETLPVKEESTDISKTTEEPAPQSTESETEMTISITQKPTLIDIPEPEENDISPPGKIPGEGDCLLNGIHYKNETNVPSTNKCHSSCRCISSIISCDPIICSLPPSYMNNCTAVYDTLDSCCPTFVCDQSNETVPPQPHSQMQGTEPPISSPSIECHDNECKISQQQPSTIPVDLSPSCNNAEDCQVTKTQEKPQCESPECKEGNILESPGVACETEKCKQTIISDTSVQPSCVGDNCEITEISATTCEGSICTDKTISEPPTPECVGEHCNQTPTPVISECTGEQCKALSTGETDMVGCENGKCNATPVPESPICKEDCKINELPEKESSCTGEECNSNQLPEGEPSCESNLCKEIPIKLTPVCEGEECTSTEVPEIQPSCEGDLCNKSQVPEILEPVCDGEECRSTESPEIKPSCEGGLCNKAGIPDISTSTCVGEICKTTKLPELKPSCEGDLCNESQVSEISVPVCDGEICTQSIDEQQCVDGICNKKDTPKLEQDKPTKAEDHPQKETTIDNESPLEIQTPKNEQQTESPTLTTELNEISITNVASASATSTKKPYTNKVPEPTSLEEISTKPPKEDDTSKYSDKFESTDEDLVQASTKPTIIAEEKLKETEENLTTESLQQSQKPLVSETGEQSTVNQTTVSYKPDQKIEISESINEDMSEKTTVSTQFDNDIGQTVEQEHGISTKSPTQSEENEIFTNAPYISLPKDNTTETPSKYSTHKSDYDSSIFVEQEPASSPILDTDKTVYYMTTEAQQTEYETTTARGPVQHGETTSISLNDKLEMTSGNEVTTQSSESGVTLVTELKTTQQIEPIIETSSEHNVQDLTMKLTTQNIYQDHSEPSATDSDTKDTTEPQDSETSTSDTHVQTTQSLMSLVTNIDQSTEDKSYSDRDGTKSPFQTKSPIDEQTPTILSTASPTDETVTEISTKPSKSVETKSTSFKTIVVTSPSTSYESTTLQSYDVEVSKTTEQMQTDYKQTTELLAVKFGEASTETIISDSTADSLTTLNPIHKFSEKPHTATLSSIDIQTEEPSLLTSVTLSSSTEQIEIETEKPVKLASVEPSFSEETVDIITEEPLIAASAEPSSSAEPVDVATKIPSKLATEEPSSSAEPVDIPTKEPSTLTSVELPPSLEPSSSEKPVDIVTEKLSEVASVEPSSSVKPYDTESEEPTKLASPEASSSEKSVDIETEEPLKLTSVEPSSIFESSEAEEPTKLASPVPSSSEKPINTTTEETSKLTSVEPSSSVEPSDAESEELTKLSSTEAYSSENPIDIATENPLKLTSVETSSTVESPEAEEPTKLTFLVPSSSEKPVDIATDEPFKLTSFEPSSSSEPSDAESEEPTKLAFPEPSSSEKPVDIETKEPLKLSSVESSSTVEPSEAVEPTKFAFPEASSSEKPGDIATEEPSKLTSIEPFSSVEPSDAKPEEPTKVASPESYSSDEPVNIATEEPSESTSVKSSSSKEPVDVETEQPLQLASVEPTLSVQRLDIDTEEPIKLTSVKPFTSIVPVNKETDESLKITSVEPSSSTEQVDIVTEGPSKLTSVEPYPSLVPVDVTTEEPLKLSSLEPSSSAEPVDIATEEPLTSPTVETYSSVEPVRVKTEEPMKLMTVEPSSSAELVDNVTEKLSKLPSEQPSPSEEPVDMATEEPYKLTSLTSESVSQDLFTEKAQSMKEPATTEIIRAETIQMPQDDINESFLSPVTEPLEQNKQTTVVPEQFDQNIPVVFDKSTQLPTLIQENITELSTKSDTDKVKATEAPEISGSTELQHITSLRQEYSSTTPYLVELEEHPHNVGDTPSKLAVEPISSLTPEMFSSSPTDNIDVDKLETYTPMDDFTKETIQFSTESFTIADTKVQPQKPEVTTEQPKETTLTEQLQEETSPSKQQTEQPLTTEGIKEEPEKEITTTSRAPDATGLEEEFIPAKLTTLVSEEVQTQTPISDKFTTKSTEKPISDTTKPSFNDFPPSDEILSPEEENQFPPSGGYGQEPDYGDEDQAFGPGTCRYGGKIYVSAQQIPRDDPCDFCFCFRSDIICLQQSCPPPIHGCHEEPIQGFCCPRYECPVSMATTLNITTTTTTTTTTLPPHFLPHAYKGAAQRRGCHIKGHTYKVGEVVRASSGPCLHCTCGGDGQMKCDPKVCTPEPMLRQMIAAAVSAKRRR